MPPKESAVRVPVTGALMLNKIEEVVTYSSIGHLYLNYESVLCNSIALIIFILLLQHEMVRNNNGHNSYSAICTAMYRWQQSLRG